MACFAGQGHVLLDGRWKIIRAGTVCLALPGVLNAFAAVFGHRWAFAWVRYDEPPIVRIICCNQEATRSNRKRPDSPANTATMKASLFTLASLVASLSMGQAAVTFVGNYLATGSVEAWVRADWTTAPALPFKSCISAEN